MNNPISKALEPLGCLIAVVSGYVLLGLAEGLERYAREEFFMKRPNEDVFIIEN